MGRTSAFIFAGFWLSVAGLWAQTPSVAVVFDGATAVNRDAFKFMQEQLGKDQAGFSLVPVDLTTQTANGPYRAVFVLNSGVTDGIDSTLGTWLESWPDKAHTLLITLIKGSSSVTVTTMPASPATLGVDAVASATTWTGAGLAALFGGQPSVNFRMHEKWVRYAVNWVKQHP